MPPISVKKVHTLQFVFWKPQTNRSSRSRMPELGVRCKFKSPSIGVIRRWHVQGFEDYLIFYIILADRIEVIRVLQGARDIESIFNP